MFERGYRPFFLLAALFAGAAVPAWLAALHGGPMPPGLLAGRDWHAHEMIFGYVPAVVAGFLLTAVPNWTGRAPIAGRGLAALALAWLLARTAVAVPHAPAALAAAAALAFPVALAAIAWREILAAGNRRNLPVCALVTLLAVADAAFLWSRLDGGAATWPERLGLGTAALLITLIGGRVTPAFSGNWMRARGVGPLPGAFGPVDVVAIAATLAAVAAWVTAPASAASGAACAFAALAGALRLARWRGWRTWNEPLVLIMHVGYAWLVAWLALAALAAPGWGGVTPSMPLHALGAGAIGTMTLAIMTRATLGHGGRELRAGGATRAIYVLVIGGACARVAAPALGAHHLAALHAGGALWSAAFVLFALAYGPLLALPPRKP